MAASVVKTSRAKSKINFIERNKKELEQKQMQLRTGRHSAARQEAVVKMSVQEAFEKSLRSDSTDSVQSRKRPQSVKVIRKNSTLLRPTKSYAERIRKEE